MKRTIEINVSYEWWNGDRTPIPTKYHDALTDQAVECIDGMRVEGYTSGELVAYVRLGDDGEAEDGVEFNGWWSVDVTEVK